jgi:hypothetical protein
MMVKGLLIVFYTMGKSPDSYKKKKRKYNLIVVWILVFESLYIDFDKLFSCISTI